MRAGSIELRNTLKEIIPPKADELRKAWFYRLAKNLDLTASRIRSIYYDPRSRLSFDERSRLEAMSGQFTRVLLNHHQITQRQGVVYDGAIQKLRELCREILQATDPDNRDGR